MHYNAQYVLYCTLYTALYILSHYTRWYRHHRSNPCASVPCAEYCSAVRSCSCKFATMNCACAIIAAVAASCRCLHSWYWGEGRYNSFRHWCRPLLSSLTSCGTDCRGGLYTAALQQSVLTPIIARVMATALTISLQ